MNIFCLSGMLCRLLGLLLLLGGTYAGAQKQGMERIDSLLSVLPSSKQDTSRVKLLNNIGNSYRTINPDEGIRYASRALELSRSLNWNSGIAAANNILGICWLYKSDNAKALACWDKAHALFKQSNDKRGMLKVIGNIGLVYTSEGAYAKALQNYFEALKYAEELDDKKSIAINLGNIGSAYKYLKNYNKALAYSQEALTIFTALNDRQNVALFLGNIGNLYMDEQIYDKALRYEDSALQQNQLLGNSEGIARDMSNIGLTCALMQDYSHAFEYYFKALSLSRKGGFKTLESRTLGSMGEGLLAIAKDTTGQYKKISETLYYEGQRIPPGKAQKIAAAIKFLYQSIAIDTATNDLNRLMHNYLALSEAQQLAGLYRDALMSKDKFISVKDSVFSLESKLKVTDLETKRELELKDKQIEIDRLAVAKKRNERAFFIAGIALLMAVAGITFRNVRLKAARQVSENKLSAFQARMNPHFIFNSLNSIQSLVLNGETVPSITYLSRFSKLMRQILDSSAKSTVLLQTELDLLRGYIELEQLRFDRFTFTLNVAPDISAEGTEVPAMIIQPFVENAIIHGILPKREEGVLTVSFRKEDGRIICTIDDNGIGRKASAALNAERRKDHESHGISIASNRLALLSKSSKGGVTYIDKEADGVALGTTVILQIPIL